MDINLILPIITLAISGFMVGNEIAVGFFVHPKLWTLDVSSHLKAVQPLAKVYGKVMPFWYALTLLLTIGIAIQANSLLNNLPFKLAIAASIVWALTIMYTLIGPAPINSKVAKWDINNYPSNWQELRRKWDTLHQWRIAFLIIAFLITSYAIILMIQNH